MHVVVIVSGSGKTGVELLVGTVVVIIEEVAGATVLGRLAGTLVVVVIIAGETVVLLVIGTGTGSTGV